MRKTMSSPALAENAELKHNLKLKKNCLKRRNSLVSNSSNSSTPLIRSSRVKNMKRKVSKIKKYHTFDSDNGRHLNRGLSSKQYVQTFKKPAKFARPPRNVKPMPPSSFYYKKNSNPLISFITSSDDDQLTTSKYSSLFDSENKHLETVVDNKDTDLCSLMASDHTNHELKYSADEDADDDADYDEVFEVGRKINRCKNERFKYFTPTTDSHGLHKAKEKQSVSKFCANGAPNLCSFYDKLLPQYSASCKSQNDQESIYKQINFDAESSEKSVTNCDSNSSRVGKNQSIDQLTSRLQKTIGFANRSKCSKLNDFCTSRSCLTVSPIEIFNTCSSATNAISQPVYVSSNMQSGLPFVEKIYNEIGSKRDHSQCQPPGPYFNYCTGVQARSGQTVPLTGLNLFKSNLKNSSIANNYQYLSNVLPAFYDSRQAHPIALQKQFISTLQQHYYPENGWAFVVLTALCLIHGSNTTFQAPQLFLLDFIVQFRSSLTFSAFIGSLSSSISLLFSPFVICFCQKGSSRLVAFLGSLICALGLLFTSFATESGQMISAFSIFFAIGSCLLRESSSFILSKYFKRRRVLVEMVISFACCISIAFLPIILSYLTNLISWRCGLQVYAGLFLICFFVCVLMRPASLYHPQRRAILHLKSLQKKSRLKKKLMENNDNVALVLKSRSIQILLCCVCLASFGISAPFFILCPTLFVHENYALTSIYYVQLSLGLSSSIGPIVAYLIFQMNQQHKKFKKKLRTNFAKLELIENGHNNIWIEPLRVLQLCVMMIAASEIALIYLQNELLNFDILIVLSIYGAFYSLFFCVLKLIIVKKVRARSICLLWAWFELAQSIPLFVGITISAYLNELLGNHCGLYLSAFFCFIGSLSMFAIDVHKRLAHKHQEKKLLKEKIKLNTIDQNYFCTEKLNINEKESDLDICLDMNQIHNGQSCHKLQSSNNATRKSHNLDKNKMKPVNRLEQIKQNNQFKYSLDSLLQTCDSNANQIDYKQIKKLSKFTSVPDFRKKTYNEFNLNKKMNQKNKICLQQMEPSETLMETNKCKKNLCRISEEMISKNRFKNENQDTSNKLNTENQEKSIIKSALLHQLRQLADNSLSSNDSSEKDTDDELGNELLKNDKFDLFNDPTFTENIIKEVCDEMVASCNKEEKYLTLSEFENNLHNQPFESIINMKKNSIKLLDKKQDLNPNKNDLCKNISGQSQVANDQDETENIFLGDIISKDYFALVKLLISSLSNTKHEADCAASQIVHSILEKVSYEDLLNKNNSKTSSNASKSTIQTKPKLNSINQMAKDNPSKGLLSSLCSNNKVHKCVNCNKIMDQMLHKN